MDLIVLIEPEMLKNAIWLFASTDHSFSLSYVAESTANYVADYDEHAYCRIQEGIKEERGGEEGKERAHLVDIKGTHI